MGETPQEKAEIEMWSRRIEYGLMDAVATYFHHATPGLGKLELYQNVDWGKKNAERSLATMLLLNQELQGKKFIAGNTFTIADITALCAVDFAAFVGILIPEDCLNLKRWYKDISSRPSAKA
jgi:glutathione S-transferase